uniref:NADH dehydrogenase subunit 5 n=1 Tax=Abscondita chinensis TaxID=2599921 RepID=UPI0022383F96|nr:NADH dehydrogenase subunit 5 [Abscondita chinensis]UYG18643.1 NADH dehydrogenase subunit 5 [Abscondita chinensis]UYG49124.1 NADH dehydrogenase subunit 5 [Abscondita chinensis]UYG49137.1 NADH dehydrogenase subunit 5 [Abscondita chinensis]UYG49150.1 NADH dehydrogenase subunit 5 [Abscondita chinensis]UYG49176.1 NADH dehydrogenase subunit 5 [Abscondita chinensis]
MSICFSLFLLLLIFSLYFFWMSLYFMMMDLVIIFEYELMTLNSNIIFMSILLDWMSLLFMSFVFFISSMVIYYSDEYMHGDLNINRFILLVFMFVMSMMFLIISPNLISILLGWDGLGLVSYCLVIYYQNTKSLNAGMLTALSNRIGDVGILMSIAWMMNYGSWNFIFYLDFMKNDFNMKIVMYFIVLSALTKSAQIPFSSWLPAAMSAPTPVSSLVHSSTLVTAGVYLLIRFNFCLSLNLMYFMLFISTMTMFMSGLGANFEYDLKKIIALSTLSQLGLMMSILFLGDYKLAFFHLLSHALFKALLFMCAGCMIHNLMNCQDIRFMGSLINFMPLTCTFFNISNFSLCGLPFLSGFYSKDLILEVMSMNYLNLYIYFIFYVSIGLTVSYTLRLCYYSLFSVYNFYHLNNLSDKGYVMLKGMSGLIFLVIFGGSMLSWLMFSTPYFICLSLNLKLMVVFMIMFGSWVGYEFSNFEYNYNLKSMSFLSLSLFFSSMLNMTFLSTYFVNYYFLKLSNLYYKNIDLGWTEYFGSQNLYNYIVKSSKFNQLLFNNILKIYFILLLLFIFLLII